MIRHLVMWTLKPQAEGRSLQDNAQRLRERLLECRGLVPGMGRFEVALAQPGSESTAHVVLDSEFESWAALDAYQEHPTHAALKPFVAAIRERRECVDYEY